MSNTDTTAVKTKSPTAEKPPTTLAPKAPPKKTAAQKVAATAKPAPAAKKAAKQTATQPVKTVVATTPNPVKASPPAKVKQKLVRDSFTMPRGDFSLINTLKERALTFRRPTKKSELLRAGLHALSALPDAKLKLVLDGLVPLKTGRPKKDE
ncbi:MAG: hypothetical protein EOP36_06075 [Rubrivivax sp.]|nr:MAG: hypothetical protein EOP36_06075 [Rubrivivax sp.]